MRNKTIAQIEEKRTHIEAQMKAAGQRLVNCINNENSFKTSEILENSATIERLSKQLLELLTELQEARKTRSELSDAERKTKDDDTKQILAQITKEANATIFPEKYVNDLARNLRVEQLQEITLLLNLEIKSFFGNLLPKRELARNIFFAVQIEEEKEIKINVVKTDSQAESKKQIFEHRCSAVANKVILYTNLDLQGRGIEMIGDGSNHARKLKSYRMTDTAFKPYESRSKYIG